MKPARVPARQWRHVRRYVLDRDGWRCQRCGRPGALEVHHTDGDPSHADPARLTTYCRGCHIGAHARPLTPAEAAWKRLVAEMQAYTGYIYRLSKDLLRFGTLETFGSF